MKSSNKGGDPCGASTNQRRRIRICQGFSTLVKYGKNSEGVSSQGPKKAGGGGCYFGISQRRLMDSIVALMKCPSRYINAYMWNVKQWCRWSYLQTKIETQTRRTNIWTPMGGRAGWDELGDWDWHIHTIEAVYKLDNSMSVSRSIMFNSMRRHGL